MGEEQRERETQNLKQAPGSELSAQSPRSEERRVGKECLNLKNQQENLLQNLLS